MSHTFTRRRQFSIEALEQRRLMAADLRMGNVKAVDVPTAETVVASSPVAADLKGVRLEAADVNQRDDPGAQDQLFGQIGAEDLLTDTKGPPEQRVSDKAMGDMTVDVGPLGGHMLAVDGLGPANLAGRQRPGNVASPKFLYHLL